MARIASRSNRNRARQLPVEILPQSPSETYPVWCREAKSHPPAIAAGVDSIRTAVPVIEMIGVLPDLAASCVHRARQDGSVRARKLGEFVETATAAAGQDPSSRDCAPDRARSPQRRGASWRAAPGVSPNFRRFTRMPNSEGPVIGSAALAPDPLRSCDRYRHRSRSADF